MQGSSTTRWSVLAGLLVLLGATGCRTGAEEVVLFYPPRALEASGVEAPPLGAEAPSLLLAGPVDRRVRPGTVGVTRGPGSIVTGWVRASNDGAEWVRDAARFELTQRGLTVLEAQEMDAGTDPAVSPERPRLGLELELLEAEAAADEDHPARVVLAATLRLDERIHLARRIRGDAQAVGATGVRLDPAESLAVALREALRPIAREAVALALREATGDPSLERDP